jgi:hypothetical protein
MRNANLTRSLQRARLRWQGFDYESGHLSMRGSFLSADGAEELIRVRRGVLPQSKRDFYRLPFNRVLKNGSLC